jgi:hypothetical protein
MSLMSAEQYKQHLALKMVKSFISDLQEKTGMKAVVRVDNLKIGSEENENILKSIVSLDALEKRFMKSIPFEIDKNPIRTRSRKREYVDLRCIFYYLACKHIGFPLIAAGRFSGRDHTSIIHMNRRAEALIETDDKFRSLYSTIYNNITEKYAEDFAEYSGQDKS